MKISFSGASFGGKTSLIETFSSEYNIYLDAGMLYVDRFLKTMSVDEFLDWRKNNNQEYYTEIILFQADTEKSVDPAAINIFDRSVLDYIALMSLESNVEVRELSMFYKYVNVDHVFLFYPLDNFDRRNTTGRLLDKDRSRKLGETTESICRLFDIDYDVVPVSSKASQREFTSNILKTISPYEY
jgi:hypothetical protein